jgi:hypothetical protein
MDPQPSLIESIDECEPVDCVKVDRDTFIFLFGRRLIDAVEAQVAEHRAAIERDRNR